MTKDSIKISQEINFNGLPTWVSVGATLLPEDNVLESLKALQKDIADYHDMASKEYRQSKMNRSSFTPDPEAKPLMDMIVLRQYQKAILDKDQVTINNIKAQYHVED